MVSSINKIPGNVEPASATWAPASVFVAALLCWEIAARKGWVSALFFPPPSKVLLIFFQSIMDGTLLRHLASTLLRVFLGLVLGGAPGLLLGLAMGWSHRLRRLIDPFVAATHPVPKIAVLPLIMVLFGIGELSKVIVVSLGAFFPMLISTMSGVQQISPVYFEVAKSCGAKSRHVFSRVVLPGSLPAVMSGMRLALNTAFLIAIATELVAAKEGLGAMVWFAWQTLRTEELYVSLSVTAALGIGFNFLLQRLAGRLIPWQEERQE